MECCRFWDRALAGTELGPTARLVEHLQRLYASLAWVQNPNYTRDNASGDFLANYGYAELLGKDRLFDSDSLALGILMLGPSTVDAEHRHPAAEIYYVAAGTAFWNLAEKKDIAAAPGTLITIPPNTIHKMWTINDPLIAIYVWEGDLSTRADFVNSGDSRQKTSVEHPRGLVEE